MKWLARHKAALAAALGIISTLFVYQNCAMPVDGKETPSFEEFAYQSKADTIGYMSCSEMDGADPSAFFTFRVGAYEHGGMSLAEDFYKATSQMSVPQRMDFLTGDEKNRDFQLQLAIRRSADMVAFASDSRPEEGVDYSTMFPPVNDEALAKELVSLSGDERVRSVPGSFDNINRFEGTLAFLESGVLEESVRQELRKGAYLSMTYHPIDKVGTGERTLALAPGDFSEEPSAADFNKAYGVGYNVTFAQGNVASGHPARVMSGVTETDLLTKKVDNASRWQCPATLRFKIVRPEDVGVVVNGTRLVNCNRVIDPQVMSSDLKRVRRVLRTEDWYVDMANRCIIPKAGRTGQCYGPDLDIEYNSSGCGGTAACTHFFSLCYQPSP